MCVWRIWVHLCCAGILFRYSVAGGRQLSLAALEEGVWVLYIGGYLYLAKDLEGMPLFIFTVNDVDTTT